MKLPMIKGYELTENCGNCAFVDDETFEDGSYKYTCNQHNDQDVYSWGKCPDYERCEIWFLITELNPRETMDRYIDRILKTTLFHKNHPTIATREHRLQAIQNAKILSQCYLRAKALWEGRTPWWHKNE